MTTRNETTPGSTSSSAAADKVPPVPPRQATGSTSDPSSRRVFLERSGVALAAGAAAPVVLPGVAAAAPATPSRFRLWVSGCAHVGTDLRRKRESLASAIRHSEQGGGQGGPAFEWDAAIHLGDLSGNQGSPDDAEGREVLRQFAAAKQHRREDFFNIAGNHDASGPGEETQWWFRKWIDPLGENTEVSGVDASRRKYPVEGTWERYSFRVGNLLFLLMSDRNDGGPPVGRGKRGGYPAGAVTSETFKWWQSHVDGSGEDIVVTAHHHMLKETTFASGEFEGFHKLPRGGYRSHYHGYYPQGGPKGASYLYWLDQQPDAQRFERYLAEHPGAIALWLGGHTHSHPDDNHGGRTHIERKWDVNFLNCAGLTRYHGSTCLPMSRLLTFTEGSDQVRVQCYLHTSQHAPQGWYAKAERTLPLGRPWRPTAQPAS